MNTVLLDTNIVSFILKQDTRQKLYEPHVRGQILALSFMTVAELYQWATFYQWGLRRVTELEQILARHVILPFDIELCRTWAKVRAERRNVGLPISSEDAWVAATAVWYNLPLITHNPKDFQHINNLTVITEYS